MMLSSSVPRKVVSTEIDWTYTPKGFIEEPLSIGVDGHKVHLKDGRAVACLDAVDLRSEPLLRQKLESAVRAQLRASQLLSPAPFELHEGTEVRKYDDGGEDRFMLLRGEAMCTSSAKADLRLVGPDGVVIFDGKVERLARLRALAARVASRPNDALLSRLLQSFDAAMRDPSNEFVHLYEIWDALAGHFGDEKAALSALSMSKPDRKVLAGLCNDPSLRQGRHRGRVNGLMRSATPTELDQVRSMAVRLIERYLAWSESVLATSSAPTTI